MRRLKWIVAILVVLVLAVGGGFVAWANTPLAPTQTALDALQPDAAMQVTETNGWIVFQPTGETPTTGFVFYPGGRVDARAYASQARAIAAQGYLAVIVPMPLNLAVFGIDRANAVIAAYPDIQRWAIGGHSLGGAMAARFIQANPDLVPGLALWASYPDVSLADLNLAAVSIYGTADAVAQGDGLANSRALLPADTGWVAIEGGNHSQFGWYGLQPGDNPATVSPDDQQAQIVTATVNLLAGLASR